MTGLYDPDTDPSPYADRPLNEGETTISCPCGTEVLSRWHEIRSAGGGWGHSKFVSIADNFAEVREFTREHRPHGQLVQSKFVRRVVV